MALAVLVAWFLISNTALAQSPDAPKRKSGLWHLAQSGGPGPNQEFQECVERATDDMVGGARQGCSKWTLRRQGPALTAETVCKADGKSQTESMVFRGNFDSAYRLEHTPIYRAPSEKPAKPVITTEARWVGPTCPAGLKPGDSAPLEKAKKR